jgi:hypothetical protein
MGWGGVGWGGGVYDRHGLVWVPVYELGPSHNACFAGFGWRWSCDLCGLTPAPGRCLAAGGGRAEGRASPVPTAAPSRVADADYGGRCCSRQCRGHVSCRQRARVCRNPAKLMFGVRNSCATSSCATASVFQALPFVNLLTKLLLAEGTTVLPCGRTSGRVCALNPGASVPLTVYASMEAVQASLLTSCSSLV